MRTFLVDRVIDSEQSEGMIVPVVGISEYQSLNQLDENFVETTVKNLEMKVSASGAVILVIEIEPIELGDEQISGIYEYINFCPNLWKGDRLAISRSLEHENDYQRDPNDYLKTQFAAYLLHSDESRPEYSVPDTCPECGSLLIRLEDDITRCYNSSCPGSLASALKYWWAWSAWHDQSWGRETPQPLSFLTYELIHQLIEKLKIKSVADLYLLNSQQIINSTVLSEEEATAIINALNHSKTCHWTFLLSGLGIRFIGFCRAIKFEKRFSALEAIVSADLDLLKSIKWNDSRIAHSIYSWVRVPANLKLIRELHSLGLNISDTSNPSTSSYSFQEVVGVINDKIGEAIEPISQGIDRLQNWFQRRIEEYDKKFTQNDENFSLIKTQVDQSETFLNSRLRQLSEEYRQIQTELHAIRSVLEKSTQETSDDSLLTKQYNQILLDIHTIWLALENNIQEVVDNPLTSEEFKKYQTQEAKRQQSQLEKIEKTLDKQLEETCCKLQQFVTISVQDVTKASAKVSDLEAVLQLIDEVPGKIEKQLKLEPKLKITSDKLNKLTQELANCKNSLQQQITDLIAQLLPELRTLQAEQNESSQDILSRFQTQDETLLGAIRTQQVEILPHFETVEKQLAAIVEQNDRLNEQFTKEQRQLQLERQRLQDQNDRLQSEIQQSLKEQCALVEKILEQSPLLEEANHQLTILAQGLSPAIQSVIERLDQFQPDNTSSEALDVFRQLAAQIHQTNAQLQAVRPVAAPLIDGLRQENAELRKQAQYDISRLDLEKSDYERQLVEARSQLEKAQQRQLTLEIEIDRSTNDLRRTHEKLGQSERDNLKLQSQLKPLESQLKDSQSRLQQSQERVDFLEQLPVQLAYSQGHLEETRQSLTQAQQRVANLEESVKEQQEQLTRSQILSDQAQTQISECKKTQKSLEERLETKTAELIQAQAELKAAKEAGRCPIGQIFSRVSASKFVALDTDKFGSIKKEWLDFPETTPDL